jgi:phytanoyl-CoA hydroxylase
MFNITPDVAVPIAEEYDRLGVIHIPSVLTPEEVAEIRQAFMEQVERDSSVGHDDKVPEGDPLAKYPRFVHPHRRTDLEVGRLARRWMLDERIVVLVTNLVGPVFAAQSMFYFKPAGGRGQALHQDNLFLQAHPETCVAAWIAIDDCDGENGGLQVVPGSHRYELQCPEDADATESFTNVEVKLAEGMHAEQTNLAAGDMLFFHGSVVHGSGPNRTTDRFRRSLIFHYVPQTSVEIAKFYNPMLTPTGEEITVTESEDGGACGDGWTPAGPH